jgi:hypothetical protein
MPNLLTLATGIPQHAAARSTRATDPASIEPADYANREDEGGGLYVPKAGEMPYHSMHRPAWARNSKSVYGEAHSRLQIRSHRTAPKSLSAPNGVVPAIPDGAAPRPLDPLADCYPSVHRSFMSSTPRPRSDKMV